MTDRKITELTSLTGANSADDDVLVIVDVSSNETKQITLSELENALGERDFSFADNDKLIFGDGSDLQIYHDGTDSKLEGDLTQTGKLTTDEVDLSAIAATISDTAVDLFVYDTRKDSDGGAWRKRTQHTSWYNETLNTSTRGSRKEFPAVAVIVAESNQVTIYDGDDPDLPMWMVFNGGGSTWTSSNILPNIGSISSLSVKNSILYISNSGNGLANINFIADNSLTVIGTSGNYGGTYLGPISTRNDTLGRDLTQPYTIVNSTVNDVAMTVLPNAPIDAATGLPVPTIAVATEGGVSVIKDDGTVVDITHTASTNNGATDISFDGNQISYATQQSGSSANYWRKAFIDIPSADVTGAYTHNISGITVYDARGTSSNSGVVLNTNSNLGDATNDIKAAVHDAVGFTNKLTLLDVDYYSDAGTPSESGSMVAYASSTYNTGWMNGDIKLATLSDTDATNVTGSELVTNGTFDTDTSGWTALSSATLSVDTNRLKMTNSGTTLGGAYQAISVTVGKTYTVHVGSHEYGTTNGKYFKIGNSAAGAEYLNTGNASSYTHTFTPTQSTVYLTFQTNNNVSGATSFVDDISVRLAEEDRSVNDNGLQVFGTVTKSAVATGADLVAYSGWSGSNYLAQPYNSDLDFGTGDFCVMFWGNRSNTVSVQRWLFRGDSASSRIMQFYSDNGNDNLYLYTFDAGAAHYVNVNSANLVGNWRHVVGIRRNGKLHVYIDGEELGIETGTVKNISSAADAKTYIGYQPFDGNYLKGSIALARISATVPSPEQIRKIYEDEKVLFQEGAQATLYGSSDAVTALAYDDSTELLHVGTSAGRSVFQGLRRVDNTTNAVGTAISASNGLVADE